MSKKIQLSIAEPCHENCENMNPVEKGKFCGSCQKQVVDFSHMSDRQVAEFFKKPSTGSVCGRFMTDQLERDIEILGVHRVNPLMIPADVPPDRLLDMRGHELLGDFESLRQADLVALRDEPAQILILIWHKAFQIPRLEAVRELRRQRMARQHE